MKKFIFILIILIIPIILFFSYNNKKEPIKIGAIFALTGNNAYDNIESINALKLAVNEINKNGGILKKPIKLIIYDNKSNLVETQIAAKKAVKDHVIAVIGSSYSSYSLVAADVLQKNKIIMITPISTNPGVTLTGNYIFRVCFTDIFQSKVLAYFAVKELKAKNIAILVDVDQKYSVDLAKFFKKQLTKYKSKVIYIGYFSSNQTNFDNIVSGINKSKPDLIFIAGYPRASGFLIKTIRQWEIDIPLLGCDAWGNGILKYIGKLNNAFSVTHWIKTLNENKTIEFVKKYEKLYGKILFPDPALTYDAMMILKYAIENANSLKIEKIRKSLANIKDFYGITGKISFDKNGDPEKPAYIIKYENDRIIFYKKINPNDIK